MNNALKIALLIAATACGKKPISFQPGHSTPYIRSVVSSFEQDFGVKVDIEVVLVKRFSNDVPGALGVCIGNGLRVEILDDPRFVIQQDLEPIIYHELGHCVLGLEHYEKDIDIMNAYIEAEVHFDFDHYVEKLQKRIGK